MNKSYSKIRHIQKLNVLLEQRTIKEQKNEPKKLSLTEWEDIWFKLIKISKYPDSNNSPFHFPEDGMFVFGGLFFFYNKEEGCLKLPPQKLSDWRNDLNDAADILENYANRIENFLDELNKSLDDLELRLDVRSNYAMTICAY